MGEQNPLGSWWHLARRFFEVATARPLTEFERVLVDGWLGSDLESVLFYEQPIADQRHALLSAQRVQHVFPARNDLIRAALFHDVGKRRSNLGLIGRSIASALAKLGVKLRGRSAQYLDHDRLGADELREMGLETIVVDFALHHHSERPDSIPQSDWDCLMQADHPGKARA